MNLETCVNWLEPIIRDLPDTSYETSAVEAVLNYVHVLEQREKNRNIKAERYNELQASITDINGWANFKKWVNSYNLKAVN